MLSTWVELLPELVQLLFFGSIGVSLSLGGAYVERFAVATLQAGDTVVGAWAAVIGLLLIGFAYLVTRDNLLPTVRILREHVRG